MMCALIMAGGKGERFWPLSTEEKPKQFLKLLGDESMLQMTVNRLKGLIPIERVFVVTAKSYVQLVKEQLPNLPAKNIIIEPVGKNTAPCIGLSAFTIDKYFKDATIAVLPSDHLIKDELAFIETLNVADKFIEENNKSIVTIGIKPSRPETGYGYIRYEENETGFGKYKIRKVESFVEKPPYKKAVEYLESGNYLWNGGMFVWRGQTILELIKKHLKSTYDILEEIATTSEEKFDSVLQEKYTEVESISIDYAIMEKADNIYVIPSEFGWDDLGTWNSLERYRDKDAFNNISMGDIVNIESNNNIIISANKPVVVVGLNDIFVIDSDDVILVSSKEYINDMKAIKNKIN